MEHVSYYQRFNTDTYGSWGIGQKRVSKDTDFQTVLDETIQLRAHVIVKPSYGDWWYIKGIPERNTKLYEEIKQYYLTFDDLLDMPEHLMKDFWMNPAEVNKRLEARNKKLSVPKGRQKALLRPKKAS